MPARFWSIGLTAFALLLGGVLAQARAQFVVPPWVGIHPAEFVKDTEVVVAMEVRLLSVTQSCFERLGVDFNIPVKTDPSTTAYEPQIVTQQFQPFGFVNDCCANTGTCVSNPSRVAFLNDDQLSKFLHSAQQDQRTHVMMAPKIVTCNGQLATIDITKQQYFGTGLEVFWNGAQVQFLPKNEPYTLGFQMCVQPVVSVDRRLVLLNLRVRLTDLESENVLLSPVTSLIKPLHADGTEAEPVPYTQFIQMPRISTLALDQTVVNPAGGTVLLSGWKRQREVRSECSLPVLSKIPYINRLFRTVRREPETEHVLLLVTPRIILNDKEEPRPVPAACSCPKSNRVVPATPPADATAIANALRSSKQAPEVPWIDAEEQESPLCLPEILQSPRSAAVSGKEKKIAKLLKKYEQACAEGRLVEAHKLAGRALALDPACFSKLRNTKELEHSAYDNQR